MGLCHSLYAFCLLVLLQHELTDARGGPDWGTGVKIRWVGGVKERMKGILYTAKARHRASGACPVLSTLWYPVGDAW